MEFPRVFRRWVGPGGSPALGSDVTPTDASFRANDNCLAARLVTSVISNRLVVGYKGPLGALTLTANVYQWDHATNGWYLVSTGQLVPGGVKRLLIVALIDSNVGARNDAELLVVITPPGGDPAGEYVFGLGLDSSVTPEQATTVVGGLVDQGAAGVDPWLVIPAGPVTIAQPVTVVQVADPLPVVDTTVEAAVAAVETAVDSVGTDVNAVEGKLTTPATATRSSVTAAASDTLLVAANGARRWLIIYNDSDSSLYVGLGSVAVSLTSFSFLLGAHERSFAIEFAGEVRGLWQSATGAAYVTQVTP